jgi:hypothetical protein
MQHGLEMVVRMLLKTFSLFGMHTPDMTVREYVLKAPLKTEEQREGLRELSIAFEQVRYGKTEPSLWDLTHLKSLWRKITGK